MTFRIPLLALMLICLGATTELTAKIKMSALFTDNMVLQQKTAAPVWGEASADSKVTVMPSWNRKSYDTIADSEGKWMVSVQTPKAGGPYELSISEDGSEPLVISNVLIGEVWLCSGQSNMEMPVGGVWGKVLDYEQELADAHKYTQIRLMTVEKHTSTLPEDDFEAVGSGWQTCTSESLDEFSATAYFFGKEIHRKKNVPVGLINTSWGGTVIEAWMSYSSLNGVKGLEEQAQLVKTAPTDKEVRKQQYNDAINKRLQNFADIDTRHCRQEGFAIPEYDDSGWGKMKMPGYIESVYRDLDGHVLVRNTVRIPDSWEGKPVTIHIAAIDDNDITYFNGVKVGQTAGWNLPRSYEVPAEYVKAGEAVIAIRIIDVTGGGGITGEDDTFYIEGPMGERLSLTGVWNSKKGADYNEFSPAPLNLYDNPNVTNVLYNAMINPLVPYSIKGAIWYQGCSNEYRAYQYRDLMRLMICDWRTKWGYDFPFFITQLANFRERQSVPVESEWAELREAQSMAAKVVSGVGIAVTSDIGEAYDIHPKNKQEVGRRLALQALNKAYGENVVCSGPVYEGYEICGNIIKIRFSSLAQGLVCHGDALEGFSIAGADHVFHWAEAKIVGDTVEVTCKDVAMPLAVRYAWAANPLGNLYNTEGLPASSFRTDDWPGVTLH